jgi:endonuclease VIII
VRVALATLQWQAVGHQLPVVELLPTGEEYRAVGHLGPDLLRPEKAGRAPSDHRGSLTADFWEPDEAVRRLLREPGRPIVEALLDQRDVAGIGNLWAGETCYLRGVNPWHAAGDVDLPALLRLTRRMMGQAAATGLQVTTEPSAWPDALGVRPRWPALPALWGDDRATIQFSPDVPGQNYLRRTWWCPTCQPA